MRETQVPLMGSAKEQEDRTDAEEEFLPKPRLTVNRRFESPSHRNTTGAKVFFLTTLLVLSVMFLITTTSNDENNLMSDNYDRRISSGQTQIGHGIPVEPPTLRQGFTTPKDQSYKNILLFSEFYDLDRNWYLGTNLIADNYFSKLQCPEVKCIVTSNRSYLPGGVRDFDALLFFAHNKFEMKEYPPPQTRRPEQLYVVSMLETPPHTWRTFEKDHNYFNWTMTYRFESDVFWPYGYFVERRTDRVITPAHQPVWRQLEADHFDRPFFHNETTVQLIKGKTKMAAWFVSNCNLTPSKRMDVAKQMQKFLSVDIYGKCGTLKCEKKREHDCQEMLEQKYKFYLSFENSLCQDYITEKVFSNMNYYIIPVLYNAADNSKFLPPNSYLNVLDYSSIKELTDHMKFLAANPEEYMKYFWWKEFYYIRDGYNFCDLCVKLHEKHLVERRQHYADLDVWFRADACIATPKIPLQ